MRLYGCYKNGKKESNCVRVAYAGGAGIADGVKDYAGGNTIKIGYNGARVQAHECESIAVYKDSTHIKDMHVSEMRKLLQIDNINNTADRTKSVKHAENADTAHRSTWATRAINANNADTLGNYKAGTGNNMLVPVSAFDAAKNGETGYIKLANGLIVQWGRVHSDDQSLDVDGKKGYWLRCGKVLTFPIPFASNNYSIILQGEDAPRDRDNYVVDGFLAHHRKPTGCTIEHWPANSDQWNEAVWWCNWLAIGI